MYLLQQLEKDRLLKAEIILFLHQFLMFYHFFLRLQPQQLQTARIILKMMLRMMIMMIRVMMKMMILL